MEERFTFTGRENPWLFKSTSWNNVEELIAQVIEHIKDVYRLSIITYGKCKVWDVKPEIINNMKRLAKDLDLSKAIKKQNLEMIWLSTDPEVHIVVSYNSKQQIDGCTLYCPGKPDKNGIRPTIFAQTTIDVYDHAIDLISKRVTPVRGKIPITQKTWFFVDRLCSFAVSSIDSGNMYHLTAKSYSQFYNNRWFLDSINECIIKELTDPVDADLVEYWKKSRKPQKEKTWEDLLFTPEQFDALMKAYENSGEHLPIRGPARSEGESFAEFVAKGADALIRENPELVKRLL